jgi:hypothetical protein
MHDVIHRWKKSGKFRRKILLLEHKQRIGETSLKYNSKRKFLLNWKLSTCNSILESIKNKTITTHYKNKTLQRILTHWFLTHVYQSYKSKIINSSEQCNGISRHQMIGLFRRCYLRPKLKFWFKLSSKIITERKENNELDKIWRFDTLSYIFGKWSQFINYQKLLNNRSIIIIKSSAFKIKYKSFEFWLEIMNVNKLMILANKVAVTNEKCLKKKSLKIWKYILKSKTIQKQRIYNSNFQKWDKYLNLIKIQKSMLEIGKIHIVASSQRIFMKRWMYYTNDLKGFHNKNSILYNINNNKMDNYKFKKIVKYWFNISFPVSKNPTSSKILRNLIVIINKEFVELGNSKHFFINGIISRLSSYYGLSLSHHSNFSFSLSRHLSVSIPHSNECTSTNRDKQWLHNLNRLNITSFHFKKCIKYTNSLLDLRRFVQKIDSYFNYWRRSSLMNTNLKIKSQLKLYYNAWKKVTFRSKHSRIAFYNRMCLWNKTLLLSSSFQSLLGHSKNNQLERLLTSYIVSIRKSYIFTKWKHNLYANNLKRKVINLLFDGFRRTSLRYCWNYWRVVVGPKRKLVSSIVTQDSFLIWRNNYIEFKERRILSTHINNLLLLAIHHSNEIITRKCIEGWKYYIRSKYIMRNSLMKERKASVILNSVINHTKYNILKKYFSRLKEYIDVNISDEDKHTCHKFSNSTSASSYSYSSIKNDTNPFTNTKAITNWQDGIKAMRSLRESLPQSIHQLSKNNNKLNNISIQTPEIKQSSYKSNNNTKPIDNYNNSPLLYRVINETTSSRFSPMSIDNRVNSPNSINSLKENTNTPSPPSSYKKGRTLNVNELM